MRDALEKAIDAAGTQAGLATAVGVTPQAITVWVRKGKVPVLRVLDVERVTGIPRYELRPDVYPPMDKEDIGCLYWHSPQKQVVD